MGKLAELVIARFGFSVQAEKPPWYNTLVANTPEQIFKAHPDRVGWDIFNLGSDVVYLSHETVPSATNGYYLDKNGGHIGMIYDEEGELVGYPIYAVSAGTPTLFVKAVIAK